MASLFCPFFFFFFFLLVSMASSTTLSYDIFDSHGSSTSSRSLLQAKKSCGVNFEAQNYTIITSQCKGPQYPPKNCCQALKEFACPFADEINDEQSDCASTMFSYINLYGKYPPGLFASQCREGKEGLDCTEALSPKASPNSNRGQLTSIPSTLLIFTAALFASLFHLY
ncbi:GPI-anchored protein LLG1 [Ziziphus jujuba]|uniref:GPI-anchored protein LLG1 n=1 Tax=Ziziphus jujuba TaxID=326968 RepID=A0A6P4A6L0_ZIZJJ|nr:GPI-anchored protein LLG1 [Ziziphus jujuba]